MNLTRLSAIAILMALLLMGAACFVNLARGTTTTKTQNSLGVVISPINPNAYLVGSLVAGQAIGDKDGRQATSLRIHPRGTYSLFDESILFCGDESDKVTTQGSEFIKGDLVFIYSRAASRLINGVPCFTLRSVARVVQEKK